MSDPAADNVLIHAERLTKVYADGQVRAVDDVNLAIRPGEYLAVMGPSGSGKSTLLNLLGALDRPTEGEVYFAGRPYSRMPSLSRLRADQLGFVFQSFLLIPTLTASENVQIPMFETRLSPSQRARKARELLAAVHLEHRIGHIPTRLSVGERQRVAIARALANDPAVILADEPTGNLDSRNSADILDLFARLHEERNLTLIVVTHNVDVARRAARLVEMRDGRVLSDGAVSARSWPPAS